MSDRLSFGCPDWTAIFARHPELEAPGYQEAVQALRDKRRQAEQDRIKAQMQDIQKSKVSHRNKMRNRARRRSALPQ